MAGAQRSEKGKSKVHGSLRAPVPKLVESESAGEQPTHTGSEVATRLLAAMPIGAAGIQGVLPAATKK